MEKKKILFVCQYFYPETFRGNDVAFHLAEKGHDVHVITGTPNYPAGKFFAGYGVFKSEGDSSANSASWSGQQNHADAELFQFSCGGLPVYVVAYHLSQI